MWFLLAAVSRSPLVTRLTSGVNAACGVAEEGASAAGVVGAGAGADACAAVLVGGAGAFPDRDNQTPSPISSAAATVPIPAHATGPLMPPRDRSASVGGGAIIAA